ncbi:coiled-coil domain-containing protein R3HCC1L-like [Melia azedarach]|uniref:Coiled-coil domain-containing protein R3HCC1L-like n=2 Tax=Melia azedarach TaxID=155640 RepID=A0ACC1X2H5_MELAZ|nr:coiled-coil domain-containing protein R3HCC1L-like [Melia azedarach]KAJ4704885.1 coiled-coil domain-containing protein R3HCC1L-like [Melia azedarach]
MEKPDEETKLSSSNWSEAVEDLVAAGDTDAAISLLESTVSKLENEESTSESVNLQLASALTNLANLYSSKGFSLKSDHLLSRAFQIRNAKVVKKDLKEASNDSALTSSSTDGDLWKSVDDKVPQDGSSDDDWEAIADRSPDELLSSQSLPEVSKLSFEDTKVQAPKRRGRGTFSYKKNELYSDRQDDKIVVEDVEDVEDEDVRCNSESNTEPRHSKYGTHHVLVLSDFSPSTRTIDLEKLFKDIRDRGVVIRWVNDTTALAVFRTPSIALEARNNIQFPFTVRILDKDDILLGSISARDLEPPRQRPQTSAQTAQRLIAQSMGFKLPSTAFGSRELKSQEEARRNRIQTRQKLKDDAWGPDD